MSSTAEQMRAWRGPALLTFGFRPFFLGAGVWAVLIMALWVPMLSGALTVPTAFDPVSWHAHEFLFGYLSAVVAGFLLTAVPNWTGRLPIVGWSLGGLAALWVAGRVAVGLSLLLPPLVVAVVDLAMPFALGFVIAREIVAGKNWKNLIVLGMLAAFTLANALFHWEAATGSYAAQGYGLRLGLGAGVMMIAVIGGRIVPSFTRNWLVKRGDGQLPTPPMQKLDKGALLLLLAALLIWVVLPDHSVAGLALLLAGIAHTVRLARWAGHRTGPEPLVAVLHVAYALVPLGALAIAAETLRPDLFGAAAAQHIWMAGAIGLMTMAVMTRATLGHTGQPLTAGIGTIGIYVAVIVAVPVPVAPRIPIGALAAAETTAQARCAQSNAGGVGIMNAAMFPDLIVNGEHVPHTLVAAETQNQDAPKGKPGIAWRKAANAVAIRTLLLQEARSRGIAADPQEVGPGRFETDEEARIRGLLEEAIDVGAPDDAAIEAEWSKDPSRFRSPPLWEVSHILIACDPRDAEARDRALNRAKKLLDIASNDPKAFAALAARESDCGSKSSGGALGQLGPGDTVPEFEAALRTLAEGEVTSEPVLTRHGYHIIRMDALALGQVLPLAAVRARIAEALEKAAWAREARRFVDQLVQSADIEGADLKQV